jgi:hypothetical protein
MESIVFLAFRVHSLSDIYGTLAGLRGRILYFCQQLNEETKEEWTIEGTPISAFLT